MEWYDSYSIGVKEVDDQHKELVAMITKLQSSLSSGGSSVEIIEALKFLVNYTKLHFATEEDVMRRIGYDEFENHQNIHKRLVGQVGEILINLKKGKSVDIYEMIDFLTNWLINHIRDEDQKIGVAMADIEVYKG
jgi:hemerythrin-like metal-binding protein